MEMDKTELHHPLNVLEGTQVRSASPVLSDPSNTTLDSAPVRLVKTNQWTLFTIKLLKTITAVRTSVLKAWKVLT